MSQRLNDLANGLLIAPAVSSITVNVTTTGITGPGVDMLTGDGNCFCIQAVGTIVGVTGVVNGTIQQSPNGTSAWTALAAIQTAGTTLTQGIFPTVISSGFGTSANVQVLTFQRDMRFLRYIGVVGGVTIAASLDVYFIEQLKNFGG